MRMLPAALALATLVFTGAVQAADWKPGAAVRIATEGAYPPWNDTDVSGKLVGFEIDLAADLCRRMKVTCKMIPRAWEGIITALRAGAFDAIMSGMAITAKRRKRITYSRPFAASPHVFVVRAGGPLAGVSTETASVTLGSLDAKEKAAIGTLREAFAGKTVGVQAGTVFVNFLKIHMADAVRIRTFKYQGDVDAALLAGRVDALLAQTSKWFGLLAARARKGAGKAEGRRPRLHRRLPGRGNRYRHPKGRPRARGDVLQGHHRRHRRRDAVPTLPQVVRLRPHAKGMTR